MAAGAVFIMAALFFAPMAIAEQTRSGSKVDIKTISADFVQTKKLKILTRPLVSKGRFFFSAPDSIRWEYLSPVKSVLLMHKGGVQRLIVRNGRFVKDATFRPEAMSAVVGEMKNWLTGRARHSRLFDVKRQSSSPASIQLTPKDKRMTKFIQRVEIEFTKTPGVAKRVIIVESRSAATVIEFTNIKLNKTLPAAIFEKAN